MAQMRLLVSNLESAIEFYVGKLGFELVEQWGPAFAIVQHEGLRVWLSGPQTSAAKPLEDGRVPCPGGWNRVVLAVPDLAQKVAELEDADVVIASRPISGPGGQQALIEDGVGNFVELFEERSS